MAGSEGQKSASATAGNYRAVKDQNPYAALGRAVAYMMTKPAFARVPFGHWSKTLTGQINRGHYFFVYEDARVVGFLGWAFVPEDRAVAWAEGRAEISFEESVNGDCIVINAWSADTPGVNRFILERLREIGREGKRVFAKRFYKDGRTRPVYLDVNDFVDSHIGATTQKIHPQAD